MSKTSPNPNTKLSRREAGSLAIIGALAASTAGFPVTAKAAAPQDRELRALFAEAQELKAELNAAYEHVERVSEAYSADVPPLPERSTGRYPPEIRAAYDEMTFSDFRHLTDDHPVKVWERETKADYEAKFAVYREARDRANEKHGMSAAEDAAGELDGEMLALGLEAFAIPAESIAGMLVKVRMFKMLALDENLDEYVAAFWRGVASDIERAATAAGVTL